jgi:serine/threonine protein kinase
MPYCCINRHLNQPGVIQCTDCNSLLAGVLVGDYRVLSYVGSGTTSDVYMAEQDSLNKRKVAIKVLHRSCNQRHVDNFHREAALLASLSHPYILPIFSYGVIYDRSTSASNCVPYLVVQFAEQGSLDEDFERGRKRPWPLERVVTLAEEVAEALDYAHSRNVLHRDVKPANLLKMGTHVVLSDFSVASLIDADSSHLSTGLAGSPAFMAPEVWGMRPGRYSDQYALAVTCFLLLAGDFPFRRSGTSNVRSWAHLHNSVQPSSLSEFRADLPSVVNDVLQKALAKNPHARYATVHAFAADLFAASQDTTVIPPKLPRFSPVVDGGVRPALGTVQREREEEPDTQLIETPVANTPVAVPIALPATPVPAVNAKMIPVAKNYSQLKEVDTEVPHITRYNNSWIWRALLLNLLICLVLAAEYSWQTENLNSGVALFLALSPILLVGPLLAIPFRRVSSTSLSRNLLWGIYFGVTNVLFCVLICLPWYVLLRNASFGGSAASVLSDFFSKILAWDQRIALLMLLALWMSVIGGVLISIFNVRNEEPLIRQGSHM